MWFLLQVLLSFVLLVLALFGSWFVVWKLILSQFPFFQEILGLRPRVANATSGAAGPIQTAEQAAAIKKRKQKEANTFVLTRSGEQMAALKRRESIKAAAMAQQAAQGGRGTQQPTTTPWPPATPSGASLSGSYNGGSQRGDPFTPATGSDTPITLSASSASINPALRPISHAREGSATSLHFGAATASPAAHPSALPTSNSGAAAIAAEALHRRKAAGSEASSIAPSPAATPATHTHAAATSSQPVTIGGSAGWLQRAAIYEDYNPNR